MGKQSARWRPLAALLAVLPILLSCSPSSREGGGAVKNPDTYTRLTISDFDSLDPAWMYDSQSRLVILNVYEHLFGFRGESVEALEPLVASEVPSVENGLISSDGLIYTIPIRDGLTFHDGSPLTADDVKYSLMRFMLQDRSGGPSPLLLEPILGYTSTRDEQGSPMNRAFRDADQRIRVEENRVVIELPKPYAPFLSILTNWAPILAKAWCAANGEWDGTEVTWANYNNPQKQDAYLFDHMNGTGPFMLDRWDRQNREIQLVRNDNYWRTPARLQRVIYRGIDEFSTRKLMLTAGDADSIAATRAQLSQLRGTPGIEIIDDLSAIEMTPVLYFTFQVNTSANPYVGSGSLDGGGIPPDFFSDPDVRKGFAYSMDYAGFIEDFHLGKGTQARGVIPRALPGYDPNVSYYTHDLEKARSHFQRAWEGKVWENGFQFTIIYNEGNPERQTICQILKAGVEALNPKFKIDVRPIQWSTYLDAMTGSKLPMFAGGWGADYPDAYNFLFPFLHSKGHYPVLQGYQNPEIDKLIEQSVAELDLEKRRGLYRRILELAHEDVPQLVIVDRPTIRVQRSWVSGFAHHPVLNDPFGESPAYTLYKEAP